MRICVFNSYLDVVVLSGDLDDGKLFTKLSLNSNQLPIDASHPNKTYLFWGYKKPKITIAHRLLRIIDSFVVLPTILARIPLQWCEHELMESLLAYDPDAVSATNLRWRRELERLVKRHRPQWVYLAKANQKLNGGCNWRKFDPTPTVSIVLPTYARPRFIRQSIESCLNQTYRNIELIVVDDGSLLDLPALLNSYHDQRIKYIRHDRNLGLSEALNTGFRNTTGEYLTWTSDDNFYTSNAIEEMVRFLQTYPEIDLVYADKYLIHERNAKITLEKNEPSERLPFLNCVRCCFLYTRRVYETIGKYDPRAFLAEDYDYWLRVAKYFRMQRLAKPLYYYRYHTDSLTSKYSRKEIAEKAQWVQQLNKSCGV